MLKFEWVFAWYDLWLGAFYDRKSGWLYVMVPMVGFRVSRRRQS